MKTHKFSILQIVRITYSLMLFMSVNEAIYIINWCRDLLNEYCSSVCITCGENRKVLVFSNMILSKHRPNNDSPLASMALSIQPIRANVATLPYHSRTFKLSNSACKRRQMMLIELRKYKALDFICRLSYFLPKNLFSEALVCPFALRGTNQWRQRGVISQ